MNFVVTGILTMAFIANILLVCLAIKEVRVWLRRM